MREDILKVLVTEEDIQRRVRELSAQIERDYAGKDLLMVCILKGSVMFYADLARYIDLPLVMDFMAASSYGDQTVSTGKLDIKKDLSGSVAGRHVLLVEDIVDSGFTMAHMIEDLKKKNPASIEICSLLVKPGNLKVDLDINYAVMEIPNDFIVGYGLDYDQEGRNLRDIYTIVEE